MIDFGKTAEECKKEMEIYRDLIKALVLGYRFDDSRMLPILDFLFEKKRNALESYEYYKEKGENK